MSRPVPPCPAVSVEVDPLERPVLEGSEPNQYPFPAGTPVDVCVGDEKEEGRGPRAHDYPGPLVNAGLAEQALPKHVSAKGSIHWPGRTRSVRG